MFPIIKSAIKDKSLIKITLSKKASKNQALHNLFIKPVLVGGKELYSLVYRYQTKDITKNVSEIDMLREVGEICNISKLLRICDIFTTQEHIQILIPKKGENRIIRKPVRSELVNDQSHHKDNLQARIWAEQLGLIDRLGQVIPAMSHKYKQINQYIELIKPFLKDIKAGKILDMGSGKGYLTFALADYLKSNQIIGVESRQELVDQANHIAMISKMDNLNFEQGQVASYYNYSNLNGIIALHACDIATDQAIWSGIKNNAELIIVAPCCQRQIRTEMTQNKNQGLFGSITKYGILFERQAEILTDTIRALILESQGYKTNVIEFIDWEHSPKNTLILAKKSNLNSQYRQLALDKITELKNKFAIPEHYLETLIKQNIS
jgi:protein-L-isoaspartate O-methyltransferase